MKSSLVLLLAAFFCRALADATYVLRTYHRPRLGYNVVQNGPRPYPAHSFVWVQQGYTCRQWPFYRSQDDGKPCITFNKQRGFCKAGKCFGRSWNPFPAVPPPRIHPGGSGTIYTYVLVTPKYPRPMSNGGGRPPSSTSPEPPPAPVTQPTPETELESEDRPATEPTLDPRRIGRRLLEP